MIHPPDEWTIAEKPEHPQDEYHPQQSARYERANHDIGVKAMVSDPAPDQPDLWRVTVSWLPGHSRLRRTHSAACRAAMRRGILCVSLWSDMRCSASKGR